MRFYGARHENNAIAMAEGFASATGKLGVAVIGRGPATANSLHAASYANRTGSKVLIIYGEAAVSAGTANTLGPDYKSFNATGVLGAAGIRVFVAGSPATARAALPAVALRPRITLRWLRSRAGKRGRVAWIESRSGSAV